MKRVITAILVLVMLVGSITINATTLEDIKGKVSTVKDINDTTLNSLKTEIAKEFEDYIKAEWYANHMAKLVAVDGIAGYTDGTIKPNGTITKAEFTKILIASIYGVQKESDKDHWATPYITKAEAVGILEKGDMNITSYDRAITRQEMAKMVVLATEKVYKEAEVTEDVDLLIKDIGSVNRSYQTYVRKVYARGIIGGYPDRTFKATGNATRAEASTILVRLFDERERLEVVIGWGGRETVTVYGYTLPVKETTGLKYEFIKPELIAKGHSEISMSVNLMERTGLEEQHDAVEKALLCKFDQATVKKVMDIVKTKKVYDDKIVYTKISAGQKYINIVSVYGDPLVNVQVSSN
jgi:hypothetical protein